MKGIQQLSLVLVQSFDLHIEERVWIEVYRELFRNKICKLLLILLLNRPHTPNDVSVVCKLLQTLKTIEVRLPSRPKQLSDERRQSRVALPHCPT